LEIRIDPTTFHFVHLLLGSLLVPSLFGQKTVGDDFRGNRIHFDLGKDSIQSPRVQQGKTFIGHILHSGFAQPL